MNNKYLLDTITNLLPIKELQSKSNGEVFTDPIIIEEMLDKLPIHLFKNKDLKWFDPAVGVGNFIVLLLFRLKLHLLDQFNTEKECITYILSNMIYACELNKDNCNIYRELFKGYSINLYEGDTLTFNCYQEFGLKEFDIILGNPPFNSGGIHSCHGHKLSTTVKNRTIWPLFVRLSFELLKENGYLLFITPLSWLRKTHPVFDLILGYNLIWLKIVDTINTKKLLKVSTSTSFYLVQKSNIISNTSITSLIKNNVYNYNGMLNKNYNIPLAYFSIFEKLYKFKEKYNCPIESRSIGVVSLGNKLKITDNYTKQDNLVLDTITLKDGILTRVGTKIHKDHHKRKLMFCSKSFLTSHIDDGRLSISGRGHDFYILCNGNGNIELIQHITKFKLFNTINILSKYRMCFKERYILDLVPDLSIFGYNTNITEQEFYNIIGLTNDEINSLF